MTAWLKRKLWKKKTSNPNLTSQHHIKQGVDYAKQINMSPPDFQTFLQLCYAADEKHLKLCFVLFNFK